MKLYFSPGASSFASHVLLREAKLPFTLERVDLFKHETENGVSYYDIDARGMVPVLELDDGQRITEQAIVAQYICDTGGRDDLMPTAGTMARIRVMEWQNYIASEIHKTFAPLFRGVENPTRELLIGDLVSKLTYISDQLKGKSYLTGETFTSADVYLFNIVHWTRWHHVDITHLTDLQNLLRRVGERPTVREALDIEGSGLIVLDA
jgi:glutathione S-transferase